MMSDVQSSARGSTNSRVSKLGADRLGIFEAAPSPPLQSLKPKPQPRKWKQNGLLTENNNRGSLPTSSPQLLAPVPPPHGPRSTSLSPNGSSIQHSSSAALSSVETPHRLSPSPPASNANTPLPFPPGSFTRRRSEQQEQLSPSNSVLLPSGAIPCPGLVHVSDPPVCPSPIPTTLTPVRSAPPRPPPPSQTAVAGLRNPTPSPAPALPPRPSEHRLSLPSPTQSTTAYQASNMEAAVCSTVKAEEVKTGAEQSPVKSEVTQPIRTTAAATTRNAPVPTATAATHSNTCTHCHCNCKQETPEEAYKRMKKKNPKVFEFKFPSSRKGKQASSKPNGPGTTTQVIYAQTQGQPQSQMIVVAPPGQPQPAAPQTIVVPAAPQPAPPPQRIIISQPPQPAAPAQPIIISQPPQPAAPAQPIIISQPPQPQPPPSTIFLPAPPQPPLQPQTIILSPPPQPSPQPQTIIVRPAAQPQQPQPQTVVYQQQSAPPVENDSSTASVRFSLLPFPFATISRSYRTSSSSTQQVCSSSNSPSHYVVTTSSSGDPPSYGACADEPPPYSYVTQ